MSYRNTRGNNAANSPNALFNRRYGTRRNENSSDSYNPPVYSTQAGYQSNQNQASYNPSYNSKQAQAAVAVKQEFENQQQMKREEYQAPAVAKTTPATPAPAAATPPTTPAQTAAAPAADTSPMVQDGDDAKGERPWKRKNFQKLPKKVRKKRLNAKLRNLLAPKNAMMVLHELHPGLSCITNEETTNAGQLSYAVIIDIEGKQYKGQGLSKAQAKQTACENALKAALFEKMAQSNVKAELPTLSALENSTTETQAMDTTENESGANGDAASTTEGGKPRKLPEEDDVPWGSLASYALFKLFSEWQAQGYNLPTSPGKPVQATNTMMPMKKMPADAAQRHPVQLLNQLKPLCQYFETRDGNPPNMVFTFTVTFDGQSFVGVGPNKKDAKKACAKNGLISLGIQYSEQ